MQRKQLENIKTDVVTLQEGIKIAEKKEQDFLNQLRPSNVFYFYKKFITHTLLK